MATSPGLTDLDRAGHEISGRALQTDQFDCRR
jgi:hypothetical protein